MPRKPTLAVAALALLAGLLSCARQLPTEAGRDGLPTGANRTRPFSVGAASSEFVVELAPGASAEEVARDHGALLLAAGDNKSFAAFATTSEAGPAALKDELGGDPRVLAVEPNKIVTVVEAAQKSWAFDDGRPTLQATMEQPARESLGVASANAVSLGDGIRVAILDTGIDPSHPLIAGRIVATADFLGAGNPGALDLRDGVDNDEDGQADEAWGHGTHVAGIVAITAPGAQLMIGRVLDADGRGDVLGVVAGIHWAIEKGADVINLSLGMTSTSHAIEEALEDAEDAGVIVVAAAGNRGAENPQEYPARSDKTIAVAASDVSAKPADFTSYGRFVDFVAPGIAIRSAYPGSTYRLWSGTSMSSPFLSATVAMLLSRHPDWSAAQVLERVRENARPIKGASPGQSGKLGAGMLDVGASLRPDLIGSGGDDPKEVLRPSR